MTTPKKTEFISTINAFKQLIERQTVKPAAPRPFVPLKGYVLPRAEDRAKYAAIPSQYQGAA